MITDKISASFFVASSRCDIVIKALESLLECETIPKQILCYFNPAVESSELNKAIKFCHENGITIYKTDTYVPISKLFNHSIVQSNSPYNLICNDDIIFKDPLGIDLILDKHREGHILVKGCEAFSAFSISKLLVSTIGFFDENFTWAWEDADYRLRMSKFGLKPYEIVPNPIVHLRSPSDRNDDYWDESSEYFFRKWDVQGLLAAIGHPARDIDFNAQNRRNLLMSGFFGDYFYDNLSSVIRLKNIQYCPIYESIKEGLV